MFGIVNSFVKTSVVSIAFALLLTACNGGSKSGECYYERYDTQAEVLSIVDDPDQEGMKLVQLDFKASTLAFETQELGKLKGIKIDQAYIDRNHIREGNKYEVVVSEISQGDCTPSFVTFNHNLE